MKFIVQTEEDEFQLTEAGYDILEAVKSLSWAIAVVIGCYFLG